MTEEQWRIISGFTGRYYVSNYGRVRSVSRRVSSPRHGGGATRLIHARVLALQNRSGYLTVSLLTDAGQRIGKQVHRLVAEAFLPNPNCLPQVNHLDADTTNARADNLEWCTASTNIAHSYKIGNRPVGQDHHFSRLERDAAGRCMPSEHGGGWEREEF